MRGRWRREGTSFFLPLLEGGYKGKRMEREGRDRNRERERKKARERESEREKERE